MGLKRRECVTRCASTGDLKVQMSCMPATVLVIVVAIQLANLYSQLNVSNPQTVVNRQF